MSIEITRKTVEGFKLLVISLIIFSTFGCAVAAKIKARDEMEVSKAEYKECLKNESDVTNCEGLKSVYEADLQAFHATSDALKGY